MFKSKKTFNKKRVDGKPSTLFIFLNKFMRLFELYGPKKHYDQNFSDLMAAFEKIGGQFLGSGRFARVIGHSSWPYVYKIFAHDDCYLDYVDWASTKTNPCIPKFYGKPKNIIPFWSRSKEENYMWVVKQERLEPIPTKEYEQIYPFIFSPSWLVRADKNPDADELIKKVIDLDILIQELQDKQWELIKDVADENFEVHDKEFLEVEIKHLREQIRHLKIDRMEISEVNVWEKLKVVRDMWKLNPQLKTLMYFIDELNYSNIKCSLDIHQGNIMKRKSDGNYVVIDPFWHGSNPYMDYDEAKRRETFNYDDDYQEPLVRGGQIYKPKPKKDYVRSDLDDKDIPF